MNATKLLLIVSIVQMFFSYPLRAEHYYYKQISLKAGLPSTVHCIAADNRGFVWMGTRSGLGRFDGQELKNISITHPCLIHFPVIKFIRLREESRGIFGY